MKIRILADRVFGPSGASNADPVLNISSKGTADMPRRSLPSAEYLRQRLRYDPDTGKLFWLPFDEWPARVSVQFVGKEAGCVAPVGYVAVRLDRVLYWAHRVIWKMERGCDPDEIDHINHVRTDNRLANLREVDRTENSRNYKRSSKNTSGHTGVVWCKQTSSWAAQLRRGKSNIFLGRHRTLAEAVEARRRGNELYGFHPNHGKPEQ